MKRAFKLIGLAAATTLALSACSGTTENGGGAESAPEGDGKFVFAAPLAANTLDPDLMTVAQMAPYALTAYDSLLFLNPDETVSPLLAESYDFGEDDQGHYLELALQQGLTFEDGTEFTSRTVELNIERSQTIEGGTHQGVLGPVTVEVIDDYTVRLHHPDGVGHLPRMLSGHTGAMISDKAIEDGTDLTSTSAGIGPYKVESSEPNRVVYTQTENYWDPEAQGSESIEILYMADDAKLNAVRAGEVDVALLPPAMVSVGETAGYNIEIVTGAENYTFNFNTEMAPFDDPRVIEAMSLALDREAICDGLLDGYCEPNGQFFGAGTEAYDSEIGLSQAPYDMERAKQLIEEAGATGAKAEIVTVAGNQVFLQLAEVIQQQYNEAGLDITVSPVPPPQLVGRFTVEKNAAIAFGATGNSYDPWESVNRYGLPTGLYNPGGTVNDYLVEGAAAAMIETDQTKRNDIYREMSSKYIDSTHMVPVMTPQSLFAVAPHVEGWEDPWAPSFLSLRGVKG